MDCSTAFKAHERECAGRWMGTESWASKRGQCLDGRVSIGCLWRRKELGNLTCSLSSLVAQSVSCLMAEQSLSSTLPLPSVLLLPSLHSFLASVPAGHSLQSASYNSTPVGLPEPEPGALGSETG